ncbi:MAG TPA: HupE/UreJ family protein [Ignavibacteria bacterium]|nr:HupE/UreJ family protein [Ignavibacteria bacterium]
MKKIFSSKLIAAAFSLSVFLIIGIASSLYAHPVDLTNISRAEIGWVYLQMGFTHILPSGIDHILFILGIYLLNPNLKTVLIQATAFTIAHTITLTLSTYEIVSVESSIVEPIIALSIMFIAIENIFAKDLKPWRIVVIFIFGLVHGLGFASGLKELGLPESEFVTALVTFTIGVELGQVTVILLAYYLIGKWFSARQWYHQRVVVTASLMIAVIALYWTVERIWY